MLVFFFFFQAQDGIRYLVRSRGLGDVYKRQVCGPGVAEVVVNPSPKSQKCPVIAYPGKNVE